MQYKYNFQVGEIFMTPNISKHTLQRLPMYLSYIQGLPEDAPKNISATTIAEALQLNMFHHRPDIGQLRRLQAAVDEVNGPLNLDSRLVVLGAELTGQNNTRLRREMLSKCPTTKWSDRIDIAI